MAVTRTTSTASWFSTQFYDFATWFPARWPISSSSAALLGLAGARRCAFWSRRFATGRWRPATWSFAWRRRRWSSSCALSPRRSVWRWRGWRFKNRCAATCWWRLGVFVVDLVVRRLVSRTRRRTIPSTLYLTFVLTATTYLAWAAGAVPERLQPAGRLQEPHDLHGRHQAGPLGRDRAGADSGLHADRHGDAGRHGRVSAMSSPSACSTTRTRSRSPACEPAGDRRSKRRNDRPHLARARASPPGDDLTPTAPARPTCKNSHWHDVTSQQSTATRRPIRCRVPRECWSPACPSMASLRFKDRAGKGIDRGISVGKEWTYRSFVEGGTPAAAIWTFHDITPERFPDGLADRNDDPRVPQPQGDINKRD